MTANDPIWIKDLERFTLLEYAKAPNFLPCAIVYGGGENEDVCSFHFGDWGMEREEITQEMCFKCCQAMLDANANVSVSSFKDNLDYAENYFFEVDVEDED